MTSVASSYRSPELGGLQVVRGAKGAAIDVGEWRSTIGSRKNDDGSVSLITLDPGFVGFEFVIGNRDGKRVLIVRDGQHEYLFTETGG